MKILHIYNDYYPSVFGGIEKHINTICEGLKEKFQMQVLISSREIKTKIENINGVEIISVPEFGRIQSAPVCPTMPIWLKRLDSNILHFHLPCPTGIISYLLARPKGKIIVTYHSDIVRQKWAVGIYKPLLLKFLKKTDCIIASSSNYIESSPFLRKFKGKCIVIPYGIDISRFYYEKPTSPTVLFVGKLRYYKGLEYLIKAMKKVDAKLLIIGTGPEENKLKKMVNKMNLQPKIDFLGNIPEEELPYYYSTCSIFALPSTERSEAFGISQIEAMASSKPVISTNLDTGVPWVNRNGVTGLTVTPRNPEALSNSINRLLKDTSLSEQLGKNGRKNVEEKFTDKIMLNNIENIYNRYKVIQN